MLLSFINIYIYQAKFDNDTIITHRWTGSNTNPNNNDGQGKAGTDRSNIVMLRNKIYPEGNRGSNGLYGHWGNNYPDVLANSNFTGLSSLDMLNLALLSPSKLISQ